MPEHLPQSKPEENHLDFMQVFDGSQPELDDIQIERATRQFSALVSDKLKVWPRDDDSSSARTVVPTDRVRSDMVVDDGIWSITVERRTDSGTQVSHPEIPEASVSLIFFDVAGHEREEFNYGLSEGVVRRDDLGDLAVEPAYQIDPTVDPGEFVRHVVEHQAADLGTAANEDFEEVMGLNRQPVSPAEISGLSDFLDEAT